MGGLIVSGLVAAIVVSGIVIGVSVAIGWLANRVLRDAYEPTLAFMTSGIVPVGLLGWSIVSFSVGDCCETGAQAQGAIMSMIVHAALLLIAWPLGYRANLWVVERSRA